MARLRKQTNTMEQYLDKIRKKEIRNEADAGRHFVWNREQVNELLVTVLREEYMPPVILGENGTCLKLVDGVQRSAALNRFRYANYKITSVIGNSLITYRRKVRDENGIVKTNAQKNIIWEEVTFDVRNKTYDNLPEELQKRFCEYPVEEVIYENCDERAMSCYVRKYNNHTAMNTEQKALTRIGSFAGEIREIVSRRFFRDYSSFTEKEKMKGVPERVVVETIMCSHHLNDWRKQMKTICAYLELHATKKEFETLDGELNRLEHIITEDIKALFNSRDAVLFLTLFHRFVKLGVKDDRFAEFLRTFQNGLRMMKIQGRAFDEISRGKRAKDKTVLRAQLKHLQILMKRFLDNEKMSEVKRQEEFLAENVRIDKVMIHEDMELYQESLNDLVDRTIRIGSRLREEENRLSLLAMVAYSYQEDKDLDDWLAQYAEKTDLYDRNPVRNYLRMREDFERYEGGERKASLDFTTNKL